MTNIELKVRVSNLSVVRRQLRAVGAQFKWRRKQKDTYFICPTGRLKIREAQTKNPEIIFYKRPDTLKEKLSDYQLFKIKPGELLRVLKLLKAICGVKNKVTKTRELWYLGHTRIHLDRVVGLGDFLELETEVGKTTLSLARKEYAGIIKNMALDKYPIFKGSYSDMR